MGRKYQKLFWPSLQLLLGQRSAFFGVSMILCIGVVFVAACATFLFFASGALNLKRKALIRALLLITIILTALVGTLSFQLQLLRFFVVDWIVLALYLMSLALGLWAALFAWQKLTATLVALLLVIAPFTPDIETTEKWSISLKVVNEVCEPLPLASAACEVVAVESLKDFVVKDHTGIGLTDDKGEAKFEVTGNPLLKGAVCGAFRIGTDETTDPTFAPQTVLVPAPFIAKAKAQVQLSRIENRIPVLDCEDRK